MPDSTLYLYTSLTAGSSHIVTATARLETILKANRIPFRAIDVATDDKARQLWGRRARGKKLPGLVKYGTIVGDMDQIEEWNEYGELRMQIDSVQDLDNFGSTTSAPEVSSATSNPTTTTPVEKPAPKPSTIKIQSPPSKDEKMEDQRPLALRQASEEAAIRAKENARTKLGLNIDSKEKKDAVSRSPATTTATTNTTAATQSVDNKKKTTGSNVDNQEEDTRNTSAQKKDDGSSSERGPSVNPGPKLSRPSLEQAAESTANFGTDDAKGSGLVSHHHGSIVSATSPGEQAKVADDVRKSISDEPGDAVHSVREENSIKKMQKQAKEEIFTGDAEHISRVETTDEVKVNKDDDKQEDVREEVKQSRGLKEEPKTSTGVGD